MNGNNTTSSVYLLNCDNTWHARLVHVNYSYIKQMHALGILKDIKMTNPGKCEICAELLKPLKSLVR